MACTGERLSEGPDRPSSHDVCLCLLPRKDDHVHRAGHVWLTWRPPDGGDEIRYRGYRWDPDGLVDALGVVPYPEGRSFFDDMEHADPDRRWLRRVFMRYRLPGIIVDEEFAVSLSRQENSAPPPKCVPVPVDRMPHLDERTATGRHGHYSWNEAWDDTDNCSSWALKVLIEVAGDEDDLRCSRPKCLEVLQRELFDTDSTTLGGCCAVKTIRKFQIEGGVPRAIDLTDQDRSVVLSRTGDVLLQEGVGRGRLGGACIPADSVEGFETQTSSPTKLWVVFGRGARRIRYLLGETDDAEAAAEWVRLANELYPHCPAS